MRTEELEDYPQYKEAVEKCPPGNVGPRGIMPSAWKAGAKHHHMSSLPHCSAAGIPPLSPFFLQYPQHSLPAEQPSDYAHLSREMLNGFPSINTEYLLKGEFRAEKQSMLAQTLHSLLCFLESFLSMSGKD